MRSIETVAVLGTGDASTASAILTALAGCAVRVHHPDAAVLEVAFDEVRFRVDLAIERGLLTRADRQRILDGILFTPDLEEAVTAADLVLETALDRPSALERLGMVAELVRATATLALPRPTDAEAAAALLPQPGRLLAMSVARRDDVSYLEVDGARTTAPHTLADARSFAARVNGRGRSAA